MTAQADFRTGTITSLTPVAARLDGMATSTPLATWSVAEESLAIGQRVLVGVRPVPGTRSTELHLMGVLGGVPAAAAPTECPAAVGAMPNTDQMSNGVEIQVGLSAVTTQGGMTWSTANGGGPIIPYTGLYRVTANLLMQGATGRWSGKVKIRWDDGVPEQVDMITMGGSLASTQDTSYSVTQERILGINDQITLSVTAPWTLYGETSRVIGTTLSVSAVR